jgi:hypothetical protein
MNLPKQVLAKARGALAVHWDDRAAIYRLPSSGQVREEQKIYTDIPCHLSVSSENPLAAENTAGKAETACTLFVGTDVQIREGDRVSVTTKEGQNITARIGKPVCRDLSNSAKLTEVVIA